MFLIKITSTKMIPNLALNPLIYLRVELIYIKWFKSGILFYTGQYNIGNIKYSPK